MSNFPKHIFFFLLMALISGAVLNQQAIPQAQFSESTTINPPNQCQKVLSSITASEESEHLHFDLSSESNTTDTQPKTITSCNSLLNILPSENNFTFNPGEQEINIKIYNALLSSQIFVFQEPDPPRLG